MVLKKKVVSFHVHCVYLLKMILPILPIQILLLCIMVLEYSNALTLQNQGFSILVCYLVAHQT